jgi:hypothetical protein
MIPALPTAEDLERIIRSRVAEKADLAKALLWKPGQSGRPTDGGAAEWTNVLSARVMKAEPGCRSSAASGASRPWLPGACHALTQRTKPRRLEHRYNTRDISDGARTELRIRMAEGSRLALKKAVQGAAKNFVRAAGRAGWVR